MANDCSPLIDVLRELKALASKKASGFFYVVTEENHSCIIRLHQGQVEEVVFRMLRGDEAVQRLSMVEAARARFQPDPFSKAGSKAPLGSDSLEWLLGGFESQLARQPSPPSVAPRTAAQQADGIGSDASQAERDLIGEVALRYFGPIASMLCDEAFETPGPLDATLEQLASNLSSPDETQRFLQEARAALAKLPR